MKNRIFILRKITVIFIFTLSIYSLHPCFAATKKSSIHGGGGRNQSPLIDPHSSHLTQVAAAFKQQSGGVDSDALLTKSIELINPDEVTSLFFRSLQKLDFLAMSQHTTAQNHSKLTGLEQQQAIYIGSPELECLKEFDSLLSQYLLQTLAQHIPSSGPQPQGQSSYIKGLFNNIRAHFIEGSPFIYTDMKEALNLLIAESARSPVNENIYFYYSYAHIMKTALGVWAAQLQKEMISQDKGEICKSASSIFQEGFHLSHLFSHREKLKHLENQLIQIEKKLSRLKLRYSLIPESLHTNYFLALRKLEIEALAINTFLKDEYAVKVNQTLATECIPEVYKLILESSRVVSE